MASYHSKTVQIKTATSHDSMNVAVFIYTDLFDAYNLSDKVDNYSVLKAVNSSLGTEKNGIIFLQHAIHDIFKRLKIDIQMQIDLQKEYKDFIARIEDRVKRYKLPVDIEMFKQCFKEKEGVVINTFHGVKGEEYNTVIAFGILNGYIPHWDTIINKNQQYRETETKKLLYVVCSRAQKNLYLFSEQGRMTKNGTPLTLTNEIATLDYEYDNL